MQLRPRTRAARAPDPDARPAKRVRHSPDLLDLLTTDAQSFDDFIDDSAADYDGAQVRDILREARSVARGLAMGPEIAQMLSL